MTVCAFTGLFSVGRRGSPGDEIRFVWYDWVALTQSHIARYLAQLAILRDPKIQALLQEDRCQVEATGVSVSHYDPVE